MSYDDMKGVWCSPKNAPTASEMESEKAEFVKKLRNEYRGFAIRMSLIFAALTFITGKVIFHMATQDLAGDRTHSIDLRSEWALVLFLGLPWIAAIKFVRLHLRHRRAHPEFGKSILETLRATADSTFLAMKRMKIIIALHLGGVPILALCFNQLYAAGKMRPHELKSAIALFSVIIIGAVCCFLYEYFRNLVPRKRQIDELLNSYTSA